MVARRIAFRLLEAIGFLLPALPSALVVRVAILTVYFVAHVLGAAKVYKDMKRKCVSASAAAGTSWWAKSKKRFTCEG